MRVDFYQLGSDSAEKVIASPWGRKLVGGPDDRSTGWREAALGFDRAFFLFDAAGTEAARDAWRGLSDREGVARHYWARDGGKWIERG